VKLPAIRSVENIWQTACSYIRDEAVENAHNVVNFQQE